jgi:hypothetical protein
MEKYFPNHRNIRNENGLIEAKKFKKIIQNFI